ncbi:MAG: hypothetical protein GYA48_09925 [Chloroflexi bacterium]|nr:hypothetical protein [Chloroflexota bacterium]
MKHLLHTLLSVVPFLILVIGIAGCGNDDTGSYQPIPVTNSRFSEEDVIVIVQEHLRLESQPHTESRQVLERTMCSQQRAEYDFQCKPCAPGSPNFCIDEWVTREVEVPGRCPFPPSQNASWSAEFYDASEQWYVTSMDPYATGENHWYVDDQDGEVLSGYCVFIE